MAIVPFGPVQWPSFPNLNTGAPILSNVGALNTAGQKHAAIYRGVNGAIRQVYIRTGTTTTGGDLDVRIETVNPTTGEPTGTLWAPGTNVTLTVQTTDDNVWLLTAALAADAVVTPGDCFAVVVAVLAPAGIFNFTAFSQASSISPYRQSFTAAWAGAVSVPLFLPVLAAGAVASVPGVDYPGSWSANVNFSNAGPATGRGNRFDLVAPMRSSGMWWHRLGTQIGDFSARLYDTNGTTILATTGVVPGGQRFGGGNGLMYMGWSGGSVTLPIGAGYRIAIFAESAATTAVYDTDVPAPAMWAAMPGGAAYHRSVFTSGAWVDTATARVLMGLTIDGISDGGSPPASVTVEAWQRRQMIPSGPEHQKVKALDSPAIEPWQRTKLVASSEPWAHVWMAGPTFQAHQIRQVGA